MATIEDDFKKGAAEDSVIAPALYDTHVHLLYQGSPRVSMKTSPYHPPRIILFLFFDFVEVCLRTRKYGGKFA